MRGRVYEEGAQKVWHRWFAWRPVWARVNENRYCWVFWEYVQRREEARGWETVWIYRVEENT